MEVRKIPSLIVSRTLERRFIADIVRVGQFVPSEVVSQEIRCLDDDAVRTLCYLDVDVHKMIMLLHETIEGVPAKLIVRGSTIVISSRSS